MEFGWGFFVVVWFFVVLGCCFFFVFFLRRISEQGLSVLIYSKSKLALSKIQLSAMGHMLPSSANDVIPHNQYQLIYF